MALADTITNLETRRDAIAAELASFTSATGEGPDFSLDSVSVNWDAHKAALIAELQEINDLVEKLRGPCIVRTHYR